MSVARGECVKNIASNSAPPSRETENLWYLVRSRDLPYGAKLSGLWGAQGMTPDEARGFYAERWNVSLSGHFLWKYPAGQGMKQIRFRDAVRGAAVKPPLPDTSSTCPLDKVTLMLTCRALHSPTRSTAMRILS